MIACDISWCLVNEVSELAIASLLHWLCYDPYTPWLFLSLEPLHFCRSSGVGVKQLCRSLIGWMCWGGVLGFHLLLISSLRKHVERPRESESLCRVWISLLPPSGLSQQPKLDNAQTDSLNVRVAVQSVSYQRQGSVRALPKIVSHVCTSISLSPNGELLFYSLPNYFQIFHDWFQDQLHDHFLVVSCPPRS